MALTPECYEGMHAACDSDACSCCCHFLEQFDDGGDHFDYEDEWPEEEAQG